IARSGPRPHGNPPKAGTTAGCPMPRDSTAPCHNPRPQARPRRPGTRPPPPAGPSACPPTHPRDVSNLVGYATVAGPDLRPIIDLGESARHRRRSEALLNGHHGTTEYLLTALSVIENFVPTDPPRFR